MKRGLILALAFCVMALSCATFALAEDDTIRLGDSCLFVTAPGYVPGELSEDDLADSQVAYYYSDNSTLDFDVYQWDQESGETILDAAQEEADLVNAEVKTTEVNGIQIAYYETVEEYEDVPYETVTFIMEDCGTFVEIVFWLDGEHAGAEADEILNSLRETENTVELRASGLYITLHAEYKNGELTEDDLADDQTAYYYSDNSPIDIDVYVWAKAEGETLADAAQEDAALFNAVAETVEVNGFEAAFYAAEENYEGETYMTWNYLFDAGDSFVELVFWMDGADAEATVNEILSTLTY